MNNISLEVIEERTKNIVSKLDDHTDQDDQKFKAVDQNFKDVFKLIKRIELTQAKNGVVIAAIVVLSQLAVGAWVKGLF